MSKKHHTKHHYIPQCYLRNFSPNSNGIWAFDKMEDKAYLTAIDNICYLDDFYILPTGHIKEYSEERKNQLYIECDFFANHIEPEYNNVLSNIIHNKNIWEVNSSQLAMTKDEKIILAKHIAIQWFRMPYQRDLVHDFRNSLMPQMIDFFKQSLAIEKGNEQFKDLDTMALAKELNPDIVVDHAGTTFMDEELVSIFASSLSQNYWEFSVSKENDICTSDFPIVVEPHVPDVRPICEGLTSYGSEMSFPISKNIILTIWDKEFFSHKSTIDCQFALLDEKEKRRKNIFRYFYAKRRVFCYQNDFSIFELARMNNGGKHVFKGTTK